MGAYKNAGATYFLLGLGMFVAWLDIFIIFVPFVFYMCLFLNYYILIPLIMYLAVMFFLAGKYTIPLAEETNIDIFAIAGEFLKLHGFLLIIFLFSGFTRAFGIFLIIIFYYAGALPLILLGVSLIKLGKQTMRLIEIEGALILVGAILLTIAIGALIISIALIHGGYKITKLEEIKQNNLE